MFCIHKWKEIESHRFDSILEEVGCHEIRGRDMMEKLTKRGIITIIKCEKCGEIKHIRTEL